MLKRTLCFIAGALTLSAALTGSALAANYQVRKLEILDGGTYTRGHAINNAGQMVGSSAVSPGKEHAVIWTPDGKVKDLGVLTNGDQSWATDINDFGQVAGWSDLDSAAKPAARHAVLWEKDGKIMDLGTLGGNMSEACAINNSGQVVGFSERGTGYRHAFLWSAEKGMVDLGALPGDESSWAVAINDAGQIVGWSSPSHSRNPHAVLWERDGTIKDLGPMIGIEDFKITDINNSGQLAGTRRYENRETDGFVWSKKSGVKLTGRLPSPPRFPGFIDPTPVAGSAVSAVNNAGQAVGSSCGNATLPRAFVWSAATGIRELPFLPKPKESAAQDDKTSKTSIRITAFAGQDTTSAADINDHGAIIGSCNGTTVLWSPAN